MTAAGQQFLKDARAILSAMEKAAATVRAVAFGQTGTLRIGLNYSAPINPLLSKIFRRFSKLYPHVGFNWHENTSGKQLDGLYHNTLDVCFIWPTRDDASPDISICLLGKDELQLVMAQEHPLAKKQRLAIKDLRDQTIFLTRRQTRMKFFDALTASCHAAGFEPNIRTDLIQLPFIMNVAAAQQGIAFIPDFFHRIRPEGTVFRLCNFLPIAMRQMPLSLATRIHDPSPLVRNFIEAAQASIGA